MSFFAPPGHESTVAPPPPPGCSEHCSRWRLCAALSIRDWDGDYVVFNPLSGHTHVLDIVAAEALQLLGVAPANEDDIRHRLAAFLEVPNDREFALHVRTIVAHLDELGLIERTGAC
jgi:PqqD family protein of HPr-rel-A system